MQGNGYETREWGGGVLPVGACFNSCKLGGKKSIQSTSPDVKLTTNYQYNHEIYNGQDGMLHNTSNSISQPNSFQLLKQLTVCCWKVKSTHNIKSRSSQIQILPLAVCFSIHSSFIMLLHRKVNESFIFLSFFQCYYFKLKCNIKVEQEMAIQHLTVLRKKKFPSAMLQLCCVIVKGWIKSIR